MIKEQAGIHFDPEMVEGFLEIADEFPEIARRFAEAA